jgi:hypothetical protein
MKHKFTLLYFLLFFAFNAVAQNITGIWRGYFVQNSYGYSEDRYKFEIQIDQASNNAVHGVTYSYKTTVFYGKADITGIYTKKTNNLIINETKLVEVKIGDLSEPCLMTCYLEYNKMGNIETLTGTYSSRNLKDKGDCGSGKVYLEKTTTSDFYKEDFLVKKENEAKKKTGTTLKSKTAAGKAVPNKPLVQNKTTPKNYPPQKPLAENKNPGSTQKPPIKPGAEGDLIKKPEQKTTPPPTVVAPPKEEKDAPIKVPKPVLPKPDVIRKRSNELVKTLYTSAKEIKIDLYDNGEIDGDSISVYDNNRLIVSRKGLSDKPISFTVKLNEDEPVHEFTMVAENLGSIPPNTALMIVNAGGKRYELFITSNEQKNAKVIIEYKPDAN